MSLSLAPYREPGETAQPTPAYIVKVNGKRLTKEGLRVVCYNQTDYPLKPLLDTIARQVYDAGGRLSQVTVGDWQPWGDVSELIFDSPVPSCAIRYQSMHADGFFEMVIQGLQDIELVSTRPPVKVYF